MRKNAARQLLRDGKVVVGVTVAFSSPTFVELCALAGFDYVLVDCPPSLSNTLVAGLKART